MDLSARLSYLFGSEEYVRKRRQLVLIRENLTNLQYREAQTRIICSGSFGEGVAYPESDDDIMFYMTNTRVVKTYREATLWNDLLMIPSEFSPGYCLLLDVMVSYPYDFIHIMNGKPYLSSSLWKQLSVREGGVIHGPCYSGFTGNIEFDFAMSIPCYNWPNIANDWILRNRSDNDFPSCNLIQTIVQNGCHVVPVGDPDSPYGDHEWRISFSVAERNLMHSFNHAQFLVYNLLRLTLKRIIEREFPGVLCSYFMKTALFYTAENTSLELWRVDNLESCFKSCLSVLFDYVHYIFCPNYFIPDYNMIKRKINQTNRHQILDIIRYVHDIGIVGVIQLSGESSCLDDSLSARLIEHKLDSEVVSSIHLDHVLASINMFFDTIPYGDNDHCLIHLCNCWRVLRVNSTMLTNGMNSFILYRGMACGIQQILQSLFNCRKLNKRSYHHYKRIQYLLRLMLNCDVTTGKLIMATYMHMIGRTEPALVTIKQLLSEYPPYVMDRSIDELKQTTYMDVMCDRGYSIEYKLKSSYAPLYRLSSQFLNVYPYPLRIWITVMGDCYIDPLTYTYFLQSLCNVQLLQRKSTRCLVNHINDLVDINDKAEARMCVGIIKYVQGNNQSACRWVGSVHVMKDIFPQPFNERYSLSALTYISCLLNKQFHQDMPQTGTP